MATTIARIVETEKENTNRIHLYREGLFFKAYQRSAYLFYTHVKSFRAVRRFYKNAGCDVAMLGFPSANLEKMFPSGDFESADDMHVCVACPEIDQQQYARWFDMVMPLPEKKPRRREEEEHAAYSVTIFEPPAETPAVPVIPDVHRHTIRELEVFSIENATPLECMIFLSKLKSDLKKGTSGGI